MSSRVLIIIIITIIIHINFIINYYYYYYYYYLLLLSLLLLLLFLFCNHYHLVLPHPSYGLLHSSTQLRRAHAPGRKAGQDRRRRGAQVAQPLVAQGSRAVPCAAAREGRQWRDQCELHVPQYLLLLFLTLDKHQCLSFDYRYS